ncbi:hypothetical protein LSAT2_004821 [Lamellibrachia satsuma]|nr:hypothetical protein LSAT2_004821 [Lamellibrachia satsuma]
MQFPVASTTVVAVWQDQRTNKKGDSMCPDSVKRLRAIVLGPRHTIYRKRALQIIGGMWILSAVVATPTFVDYSVHLEPMTPQYVSNTTAVTSQMVCRPNSNVFDKKLTGQSSSAEGASGFVLVQLTLAVFSTS